VFKRAFAILACLHATLAWAAPEALTEADYFAEQPVVLSISRLAQPVSRAPAAVTVITREMIEASGARQLPDLLRLVPGFQVSWVSGNIQTVTYQGLASIYSRRLQVLVDGRSVYNPAYGQVQWRGIPVALEDIDRIEVVRGPNAAKDGVNAIVASIHIYTRPAAADSGWTVGAALGSSDIRDGLLRHVGERGDWQWRVTLNSRRDDWLENQRDDARDYLLDTRAEWRPNNRDEVTVQIGGALGEWDNSSVHFTFSDQQTTDFSSGYAQAGWRRTLSADRDWSFLLSHTKTRADENFPLFFGVDNLNYWFSRSALEFSSQARPLESLRTVWTVEARLDRAWSASLAGPDTHDGELYRLSGNAEWSPAEEWVWHAGAMLEKNYYAGTRLSPRLAVNWLPRPGHSLRLGASRSYRSPTFLEQESDFKLVQGTTLIDQLLLSPFELRPERMDSAELGYLFAVKRRLNLDVRLFHNNLQHYIDATSPFPVADEVAGNGADFTFGNLPEARQNGAEYQLRWQPAAITWFTLSQSWVRTRAEADNLRESTPSHTLSLLANHDFGPVTGSLGYYRVSDMNWIGSPETPAYDRLDMRVARDFRTATLRGEWALVGQSILGEYADFRADRVFEPRAYVYLKLHL
jgi:iron complex outermembrane receptor protein